MSNPITSKQFWAFKPPNKDQEFWFHFFINVPIFGAIVSHMIYRFLSKHNFETTFLIQFGTIFMVTVVEAYLLTLLIRKVKKYNYSELRKKIVLDLLTYFVAGLLLANIIIAITTFFTYSSNSQDLNAFIVDLITFKLTPTSLTLAFLFVIITIGLFFTLWYKSSKQEQELTEEKLKFQYKTLKSQVNPHFLFNSLNTLSELVYNDAHKADNYIQKLSKIYRYILEHENTEFVPLNMELSFTQEYFDLQKERSKGGITLTSSIENGDYQILPVSLQLLVENAIKHNSASTVQPLSIDIKQTGNALEVSNNLQPRDTLEESTQSGLKNLEDRISLIMNEKLKIIKSNKEFIVQLPIVKGDN